MIEIFVISICLQTTPIACENATQAYYKDSYIETLVTEKVVHYYQKNPNAAMLVGYAAAAAQGQVTIPLGLSNFFTVDTKQHTIGYKLGF